MFLGEISVDYSQWNHKIVFKLRIYFGLLETQFRSVVLLFQDIV